MFIKRGDDNSAETKIMNIIDGDEDACDDKKSKKMLDDAIEDIKNIDKDGNKTESKKEMSN